jgi:hypothetical protein
MTGHVFVIQGDTRRFACDAYLHATDKDLRKGGGWMVSAPDAPNRVDPALRGAFMREKRFTLPLQERAGKPDEPTTILTAVPYHGVRHAGDFAPRLREFFKVGARIARERGVTSRIGRRQKPLLAVPLFGTGGGGANRVRGEVFRLIYQESLRAAKKYDVDVAIVLRDPRDYALGQVIRREYDRAWPELSSALLARAQDLGALAADARLVPFMGAGVSMSAGAPSWNGLLARLAGAAGVDAEIVEKLKHHDVLDQAEYVRREFGRRFNEDKSRFAKSVIEAVYVRRYGLAPPLLAALDAEQAITLNYDRLFEWAAHDAQRPRRVIPGAATGEERWLLKLHGTVEKESSIVLTRDDYLGFNTDRAALSSLVKATLMTRHLLFVGFGMKDAHFHEIVHDVRRAVPDHGGPFGTALVIGGDPVTEKLWGDDLTFVSLEDGRMLEIFLDAVLAYGASSNAYLLAEGFFTALSPEDQVLSAALTQMVDSIPESARAGSSWSAIDEALRQFGWKSESAKRSWSGLPEELE